MKFSIEDKFGRLFYSFRLGEIVLICASNTYEGRPTRIVDLEKRLKRGNVTLKHSTIQEHLEKLVKNSPVVSLELLESKKVGRERHLYFDISKFMEYLMEKMSLRVEYNLYDMLEMGKISEKKVKTTLNDVRRRIQKLSESNLLQMMVLNFLCNLLKVSFYVDMSLSSILDNIIDGLAVLKSPSRDAPEEAKKIYRLIRPIQKYLVRNAAYANIFNEFVSNYKK